MINSYNTIVSALEQFSNAHLSLRRFKCSFFEQIDNFTTLENSFPVLYAVPNDSSFQENIDVMSFRIYCVDILQKDRSNEQPILNETLLVLRDLTNWMRESDNGLNILNTPRAIPINNFGTEFTAGWYIDIEIETEVETNDCSIPFSSNFLLTGSTCTNSYVNQYLTCDTLAECSTIINIYDILESISGNTGGSTFTGGTVTGQTQFTNGLTANTFSATTYLGLPLDIRVTGGTYSSGSATFTNNTGGTFNVTGFPIGSGGGQLFYLNISQAKNGNRYLSTTGSTASEQSTGVTISAGATGTIASFQSDQLGVTLIPGGIWSFYLHSYKQNNNASFNIFVELYKITSGGTSTLLFTSDPAPVTTNSPNPSMQLTDGYFSGTSISTTDSILAVVRATNTSNQSHTITLFSEGNQHYSYVVSTLPTQQGLTCDTLSGCSTIQTIQSDILSKLSTSGGTITGNLIVNGSLSASTYLGLPSNIYETSTDGATTSGTTLNVYTSGVLVPANSFTTGNNAELTVRGRKTGTAGNMTMRIYINNTNSIAGTPTLVATNTTAAVNQTYLQFQRFLSIKSTGTTEVFSNTGGSNIDWLGSNLGINQLSVNWANDLYIVVSTQCTVSGDSANARSSFIKIKR